MCSQNLILGADLSIHNVHDQLTTLGVGESTNLDGYRSLRCSQNFASAGDKDAPIFWSRPILTQDFVILQIIQDEEPRDV